MLKRRFGTGHDEGGADSSQKSTVSALFGDTEETKYGPKLDIWSVGCILAEQGSPVKFPSVHQVCASIDQMQLPLSLMRSFVGSTDLLTLEHCHCARGPTLFG